MCTTTVVVRIKVTKALYVLYLTLVNDTASCVCYNTVSVKVVSQRKLKTSLDFYGNSYIFCLRI